MRLWRAVVLANLALGLGIGAGYLRWGLEARDLRRQLARAQELASRPRPEGRTWVLNAVVRLVLRDQSMVFLTHEAIPDLMPAMTMGFPVASATALDGLSPGDPVRCTLRAEGDRLVIVAVEKRSAP
jgi:Cu/Ag efflux protein CusF